MKPSCRESIDLITQLVFLVVKCCGVEKTYDSVFNILFPFIVYYLYIYY